MLIRWLAILVFSLIACSMLLGISNCDKIKMKTFSACFPSSWSAGKIDKYDQIVACNSKQGNCTGNGGGFPLPGRMFLFVSPIDNLPGNEKYHSSKDIALTDPYSKDAVIEPIVLEESEIKDCFRSRSLFAGKVWNEVYGFRMGKKLFRAWVQYNNESNMLKVYRNSVLDILASIKAS